MTQTERTHSPAYPYRPRQRLAIGVAVSMLVVIMVGTAFASGVYIGDNRELAPGTGPGFPGGPPGGAPQRFGQPQVQGVVGGPVPGQVPGAVPGQPGTVGGPQPQLGPQTPGARFDIVGSVAVTDAGSIMIVTADGSPRVGVDGQTRIGTDDGQPMTLAAIRRNAIVGVRMRPGTAIADQVIVITGRAAPQGSQPGGARN